MTETALLRIGAFSRATSLSVKALRFYHEIGLLVPAVVDPVSGYRSYSAEQILDATVVRRLRDLDVPTDDIRTVLDARDPEVTRKVLDEHRAELEGRLQSIQDALSGIDAGVASPALLTGVHRRHEPARTVLQIDGHGAPDALDGFIADAVSALAQALLASGAVASGPLGACYPTLLDDEQLVSAFVPIGKAKLLDATAQRRGIRVTTLPAIDAVVLLHRGPYETLEDSYRGIGAWVAANADPDDTEVREHYLVTPFDNDEPDEWRTEIIWPLRPGGDR